MTRFKKEISGSLGAFWKENAEKEVRKSVEQADRYAEVDADGAIRWLSNGKYLMDDFCEKLEYAGYGFSREETARKRKEQDEKTIAEYKNSRKNIPLETLAEMKAAFGAETPVMDVLTGKSINLGTA